MKTKCIKSGTPRAGMMALFILTLIALTTCLNPTGFTPELKLTVDANISGDIDVYNANNAVLWVINRTASVDVYKVIVDRENRPDPEKTGFENGAPFPGAAD